MTDPVDNSSRIENFQPESISNDELAWLRHAVAAPGAIATPNELTVQRLIARLDDRERRLGEIFRVLELSGFPPFYAISAADVQTEYERAVNGLAAAKMRSLMLSIQVDMLREALGESVDVMTEIAGGAAPLNLARLFGLLDTTIAKARSALDGETCV